MIPFPIISSDNKIIDNDTNLYSLYSTIPQQDIRQMNSSCNFIVILKNNGEVLINEKDNNHGFILLMQDLDIKMIACDTYHLAILKNNGDLYLTGIKGCCHREILGLIIINVEQNIIFIVNDQTNIYVARKHDEILMLEWIFNHRVFRSFFNEDALDVNNDDLRNLGRWDPMPNNINVMPNNDNRKRPLSLVAPTLENGIKQIAISDDYKLILTNNGVVYNLVDNQLIQIMHDKAIWQIICYKKRIFLLKLNGEIVMFKKKIMMIQSLLLRMKLLLILDFLTMLSMFYEIMVICHHYLYQHHILLMMMLNFKKK